MKTSLSARIILQKVLIVACTLRLAGCVSHEGIGLGMPTQGAEELLRNNAEDGEGQETAQSTGASNRELILVGTVSSLRRFNERSSERYYGHYTRFVEKLRPGTTPELSLAEFRESYIGWTKLKSFSVPLVMGLYRDVLVPTRLVDDVYFPSIVGVFLIQEAGDLLAARTSPDGFYVVDAILCPDNGSGSAYYRCASKYEKGVFDGLTGEELTLDLEPAKSGKRIDTKTYKLVEVTASPAVAKQTVVTASR